MLRLKLFVCISIFATGNVQAFTVLARCGPSEGQSYYFEMGVVGPGQGGWKLDGYDGGRITAILDDKNHLDIWLKDASGLKSYVKEGYSLNLITLDKENRSFLIAAHGSNFIESYLFKTNEFGVGTVSWTASKVTPLVARTSIMTAECGPKFEIKP